MEEKSTYDLDGEPKELRDSATAGWSLLFPVFEPHTLPVKYYDPWNNHIIYVVFNLSVGIFAVF